MSELKEALDLLRKISRFDSSCCLSEHIRAVSYENKRLQPIIAKLMTTLEKAVDANKNAEYLLTQVMKNCIRLDGLDMRDFGRGVTALEEVRAEVIKILKDEEEEV